MAEIGFIGFWETAAREEGSDSDYTAIIKLFERAAGVTVGQANSPS